jgi:hypothetical protein
MEEHSVSRKKHRRNKVVGKWPFVAISILVAVLASVAGVRLLARRGDNESTASGIQLAPVSQLSERVRREPPVVQEAYQFAIANPEILAKLPCYCGCGNMGHTSNLDCFVEEMTQDGSIVYGYHALG